MDKWKNKKKFLYLKIVKVLHCLFWNNYLCNFWGVRGGGKLLSVDEYQQTNSILYLPFDTW
jgi:hypothetical protein